MGASELLKLETETCRKSVEGSLFSLISDSPPSFEERPIRHPSTFALFLPYSLHLSFVIETIRNDELVIAVQVHRVPYETPAF